MPRKPVDVSNYEREKNGQVEHVNDYTQMRDSAGATTPPAFTALRRKTRTGDPAVTTETDFQGFTIKGKLVESGVPFPSEPDGDTTHNHFKITLKNIGTGVSKTFDFYGSTFDYQQGKEELDREQLLGAFDSFLSDVATVDESGGEFEQFAAEMGYDTDSRMAEKVWRAVKVEKRKAEALDIEGDRLYALIDTLAEQ